MDYSEDYAYFGGGGNGSSNGSAAPDLGPEGDPNHPGGAWGSVSYAENVEMNWTMADNLTIDEFLEMMLGPKRVRI